MKNALASNSPSESYVLEIDGVPQFEFRVFVQALSAGLQLRHDLPNCSVKLRSLTKAIRYLSTETSCRNIYTASLPSGSRQQQKRAAPKSGP